MAQAGACILGASMALLLFVQDFYTAQFTGFFAALFFVAYIAIERGWSGWSMGGIGVAGAQPEVAADCGRRGDRGTRVGPPDLHVRRCRVLHLWSAVASHNWRRPALIGLTGLLAFVFLRGGIRVVTPVEFADRWFAAVTLGALAGAATFLWIYLEPYSQFGSFSEEDLARALIRKDSARWRTVSGFVRDNQFFETMRAYVLVAVVAALAWVPWLNRDRTARWRGLWFAAVSLLVFFVPLSVDGFSSGACCSGRFRALHPYGSGSHHLRVRAGGGTRRRMDRLASVREAGVPPRRDGDRSRPAHYGPHPGAAQYRRPNRTSTAGCRRRSTSTPSARHSS